MILLYLSVLTCASECVNLILLMYKSILNFVHILAFLKDLLRFRYVENVRLRNVKETGGFVISYLEVVISM